jgi:hypothetical protein
MKNYPKIYYETEKKPIHLIGYTAALALMLTGVAETAHSIPYILRGESSTVGKILGPAGIIAGGATAFLYLRQAGINTY